MADRVNTQSPTTEAGRQLVVDEPRLVTGEHDMAVRVCAIERQAVAAFVWERLESSPGFNEELARGLADVKAGRVHRWADVKRRMDEEGFRPEPDPWEAARAEGRREAVDPDVLRRHGVAIYMHQRQCVGDDNKTPTSHPLADCPNRDLILGSAVLVLNEEAKRLRVAALNASESPPPDEFYVEPPSPKVWEGLPATRGDASESPPRYEQINGVTYERTESGDLRLPARADASESPPHVCIESCLRACPTCDADVDHTPTFHVVGCPEGMSR